MRGSKAPLPRRRLPQESQEYWESGDRQSILLPGGGEDGDDVLGLDQNTVHNSGLRATGPRKKRRWLASQRTELVGEKVSVAG
ncbi:hypothetical protein MLD38_009714 [Melastoma candidum]|uniref:Uncharacterized protein n=1 Tax=Melastoma candidum TaxID=119954 RepID=A0ACB9RYE0_9MYRT|nr:hypothetical protein MLD38_009714 [Melastoma candidum]